MRFASPVIRLWAGLTVALVGAELMIRLIGPMMPESSSWPTVETDLKSHQLAQMEAGSALVLLGSSVTEAAVDPALLEVLTGLYSPYNSAVPFSSPLSNEIWLEQVLLPAVQPDLLVIGLPAWPPHHDAVRLLEKGIERAVTVPALVNVLEWSALVGKRGVLADWDRFGQRVRLKMSGLWTDLGHQTGYYNQSGGSVAGSFPVFGAPAMIPEQAAAMQRVIVSSRESGVDVVLLLEPVRFPGDATETEITAYIEWLEDMSNEWGVQLWDTYSIEWDESYFADEVHLNKAGTEAFTAYLAGLLNDYFAASN